LIEIRRLGDSRHTCRFFNFHFDGIRQRKAVRTSTGVRRLETILAEPKTRLNAKKDVEAGGNDEAR